MSELTSKVLLQFVPFESCIDPTFWHKFTKIKLDVDKLEEKVRPIVGYYSPQCSRLLNVDSSSFNEENVSNSNSWKACGFYLNMNTLENFKAYDKLKMLNDCGRDLYRSIASNEIFDNPSALVTFHVVTFADLKKYHYYYWFCFPASVKPNCYLTEPIVQLTKHFSDEQVNTLFERHSELPLNQQGFFGFQVKEKNIVMYSLKDWIKTMNSDPDAQDVYFGFIDPCQDPERPGWPLRNFLFLIFTKCAQLRDKTLSILCMRKKNNSIILKLNFECESQDERKWTGWETNLRGKFGPRFVDLSSNMDPKKLAEESVDLNLRLMKWRLVPSLDLATVKATSCLLLGAGTLGCSTARALLAWGVTNITFVDNGNVSYSNPVRQSLFTFDDCQKETSKAEAAASALIKIYPNVKSKGVKLSIPMPGRGVGEEANVAPLEQLISSHDVVFLLTDTRESRWLPTLLSAKHNKIAITAALGFDTYLVLRHGMSNSTSKLGCYFCNDVTAPGNSMQDRTLDQQCTVTRPGVSNMAAALAVEIMVSLLQHPDRGSIDPKSSTCLGEVPHSIRGFLSTYSQILPATQAFTQCTACSDKVIEAYNKNRDEFLQEVFLRSSYLEDLTGLTELHKATDNSEIMEFSDDEEM